MDLSEEDRRMLGALGAVLTNLTEPEPTSAVIIRSDYGTDLPEEVEEIIDAIADGEHDPYIELLLTALHSRKRRLRGTRGF